MLLATARGACLIVVLIAVCGAALNSDEKEGEYDYSHAYTALSIVARLHLQILTPFMRGRGGQTGTVILQETAVSLDIRIMAGPNTPRQPPGAESSMPAKLATCWWVQS